MSRSACRRVFILDSYTMASALTKSPDAGLIRGTHSTTASRWKSQICITIRRARAIQGDASRVSRKIRALHPYSTQGFAYGAFDESTDGGHTAASQPHCHGTGLRRTWPGHPNGRHGHCPQFRPSLGVTHLRRLAAGNTDSASR